ncbi:hypothetical protein Hanom_Chr15g01362751 [Helianthus anomalus]
MRYVQMYTLYCLIISNRQQVVNYRRTPFFLLEMVSFFYFLAELVYFAFVSSCDVGYYDPNTLSLQTKVFIKISHNSMLLLLFILELIFIFISF